MNKAKRYYFVLHVQINGKYGYSVALSTDENLDSVTNEDEIISLAKRLNLFEETEDYKLVDMVYGISEEEYKEFKGM